MYLFVWYNDRVLHTHDALGGVEEWLLSSASEAVQGETALSEAILSDIINIEIELFLSISSL